MKQQFLVDAGEEDIRIDKYLAGLSEGLSRSYIQKLLKSQAVLVNGSPVKGSYKVCEDDLLNLKFRSQNPRLKAAEPMELETL